MQNYQMQASGLILPESRDTRIQMMPFLIDDRSTWPDDIKRYGEIVHECLEGFKIDGELYPDYTAPCYITIDERDVKAGEPQRSPGVHTEGGYNIYNEHVYWGKGGWEIEYPRLGGGIGELTDTKEATRYGGLFIVSNVDDSTAVWNVNAENPGKLGDCSHMDLDIKDAHIMEAGELAWMHDRTPHASLPLLEDIHRQFIRIVGPDVSHWFQGDNTLNPLFNIQDFKSKFMDTKIYSGTKQEYFNSQKEKQRLNDIDNLKGKIRQYSGWAVNAFTSVYEEVKHLYSDDKLNKMIQDKKDYAHHSKWDEYNKVVIEITEYLINKRDILKKEAKLEEVKGYLDLIVTSTNERDSLLKKGNI